MSLQQMIFVTWQERITDAVVICFIFLSKESGNQNTPIDLTLGYHSLNTYHYFVVFIV
jgi:hypothetical protein